MIIVYDQFGRKRKIRKLIIIDILKEVNEKMSDTGKINMQSSLLAIRKLNARQASYGKDEIGESRNNSHWFGIRQLREIQTNVISRGTVNVRHLALIPTTKGYKYQIPPFKYFNYFTTLIYSVIKFIEAY